MSFRELEQDSPDDRLPSSNVLPFRGSRQAHKGSNWRRRPYRPSLHGSIRLLDGFRLISVVVKARSAPATSPALVSGIQLPAKSRRNCPTTAEGTLCRRSDFG